MHSEHTNALIGETQYMRKEIIHRINQLGKKGKPFLFVIDYQGNQAFIEPLTDINPEICLYDFEGVNNLTEKTSQESVSPLPCPITWQMTPPHYEDYKHSFDIVKSNIMQGNSYLTNLTCKVPVSCNLSLHDIFLNARGKYKLLWRGMTATKRDQAETDLKETDQAETNQTGTDRMKTASTSTPGRDLFVCFSPETFVKIRNGRIYSYPMKGTIEASQPNAAEILMADRKEAAEHATIVDLIRNDLSRVADDVRVDRYRYIDILHTNKGDILQTSSEISGRLPDDYMNHLGDILAVQLPAGSITGAPKDKTMQIIHEAEGYGRGFYTGIMGICQNGELNSAVMIRFIEQEADGMYFKAGGGITSKSDCRKEFQEMLQKIYLPIGEFSGVKELRQQLLWT